MSSEQNSASSSIRIETFDTPTGELREVCGYVEDRQVISVNVRVDGSWIVGSSVCLSGNVEHAALQAECMHRVLQFVLEKASARLTYVEAPKPSQPVRGKGSDQVEFAQRLGARPAAAV